MVIASFLSSIHEHNLNLCKISSINIKLTSEAFTERSLIFYRAYNIIYNEKYFSDDQFSYIVRVLTWRA